MSIEFATTITNTFSVVDLVESLEEWLSRIAGQPGRVAMRYEVDWEELSSGAIADDPVSRRIGPQGDAPWVVFRTTPFAQSHLATFRREDDDPSRMSALSVADYGTNSSIVLAIIVSLVVAELGKGDIRPIAETIGMPSADRGALLRFLTMRPPASSFETACRQILETLPAFEGDRQDVTINVPDW